MRTPTFRVAASLMLAICLAAAARAEDPAPKPPQSNPAFDALKSLAGTWVAVEPDDVKAKHGELVFRLTSGKSAMIETMFPGHDHEMINMYTLAGDTVYMTHYCAMGNQPRLKLASFDKNVLVFEYVDGGNLKSRDEPHMDSLVLTIGKDTLTQKWNSYANGKPGDAHTFEFKRKQ